MRIKRYVLYFFAGLSICSGMLYVGGYSLWGSGFISFFIGMLRNPFRVGAFAPCSRFVGKEITRYLSQQVTEYNNNEITTPLHVLEVGAGSGVLTQAIEQELQALKSPYVFDIIEIDPEYCTLLEEKFGNNSNIKIHCRNVIDWQPNYKYDYIISTVPFSNLPSQTVSKILDTYTHIIKSEGVFSYIEHMWFPKLKEYFVKGSEKKDYLRVRANVNSLKNKYKIDTKEVWFNITPIYVHHLEIKKEII